MMIWVTGARGFIGRHVARELSAQGHLIAGLGHGAWHEADRKSWGVGEWRNAGVSHANLDALAIEVGLPEAVIHLAGGSAVGPSFAQPAEDFHRSVAAASELAEWVRLRAPAARIVMASSAAVYGQGHAELISEQTGCRPYSPYGFHKRMGELLLESYARNFGIRVAIVRLFSVYGPELKKQLLWDVCMRLAAGASALTLGGSGAEMRDWLHVNDAARLIGMAIDIADGNGVVINGGTGIATSIGDVGSALCEGWGISTPVLFTGHSRPGDPLRLVADVSHARSLGFLPAHAWHDGVREYVRWFQREQAAMVLSRGT